uniref:Nitrous oxide reductase accessory protein NosL n=1 Tax=Eiseniibacteriota bacterium TaxID=2212470 RepID=A0A832I023_UNCEI
MRDTILRRDPLAALARVAVLGAALLAGCGGARSAGGPPPIEIGARCSNCGMRIEDLAFASERQLGGAWLPYESIECLIADMGKRPGGTAYVPDHDTKTLHAATDMWIVKGNFPSPMGGGFAAFADRAAADTLAAATEGTVDRLEAFLAGGGR